MRFLWFLLPVTLSACVETRLPVTEGRILTAEQFAVTAAGYRYITQELSISIHENGRYDGTREGTPVAGTWEFADGQFCVTRTEPAPLPTDCQIWTVRGNSFTVARNGGRGPVTTYLSRFALPPSYEQRVAQGS